MLVKPGYYFMMSSIPDVKLPFAKDGQLTPEGKAVYYTIYILRCSEPGASQSSNEVLNPRHYSSKAGRVVFFRSAWVFKFVMQPAKQENFQCRNCRLRFIQFRVCIEKIMRVHEVAISQS